MHLARAGEIALVELPDSARQGTKCRGPSTQPHIPSVVRLPVGMTGLNIVNNSEIYVDIM